MTSSILTPTEGGRDPKGSGSRPSDQARSGLGGSRFDPSRIVKAFNERLAIYRDKRDGSSQFGHMTYNRHEAYALVVEAVELLAREAGLAGSVPACQECPECQGRGEVYAYFPGLPRTPDPILCEYCCGTGTMAISGETIPLFDASGIEAPSGVETGNTDSTEGESPTGKAGDAQGPPQ